MCTKCRALTEEQGRHLFKVSKPCTDAENAAFCAGEIMKAYTVASVVPLEEQNATVIVVHSEADYDSASDKAPGFYNGFTMA